MVMNVFNFRNQIINNYRIHGPDYPGESFRVVKEKEVEQYGSFRTKEAIREIYDATSEAIRTGQPYQTRLDPRPGPPVESLPVWNPGQPRPAKVADPHPSAEGVPSMISAYCVSEMFSGGN